MTGRTEVSSSPKSGAYNGPLLVCAWIFSGSVILFSVLRMTWHVLSGSRLQYADYWRMLEYLLHPDGSLNIAGIFHFSNEHLTATAQLLYWFNLRLFSGSNISLGFIDIVIVLLTLLLLVSIVLRSRLDLVSRALVIGLAGALLFSLAGAWNFLHSMSGAAWLTANLFILLALHLRDIGRYGLALFAALVATISYSTGLLVWPTLVAYGMARFHYREWWREWPYVCGMLLSIFLLSLMSPVKTVTSANDPLLVVELAATFLGQSLGFNGAFAFGLGLVALFAVPLLSARLIFWRNMPKDAIWVGVALYGWAGSLLLCYKRAVLFSLPAYPSRYYSIAAFAWIGLMLLLLLAVNSNSKGTIDLNRRKIVNSFRGMKQGFLSLPRFTLVLTIAVTIVAVLADVGQVELRDEGIPRQELKEIALRLDAVDGSVQYMDGPFTNNLKPFSSTTGMRNAGHYPFVEDWNMDCGLLGKQLEHTGTERTAGYHNKPRQNKALERVVNISGKMAVDGIVSGPIRCLLVADAAGRVVGIGRTAGAADKDGRLRFNAFAHQTKGKYSVYLFDQEESPVRILKAGEFIGDVN